MEPPLAKEWIKALADEIRATGGVVIGTNSPSNELTVAGDADFTGSVGIGTNAPLGTVSIGGPDVADKGPNLYLMANATQQVNSGQIRFTEGSDTHLGMFIKYSGSNNRLEIGGHPQLGTDVSDDNVAIAIERGSGEVGIGTTSPTATMHILSSSTSVPQLRVETTSTTNYARISMSNSAANYWDIAAGAALNDELNLWSDVRGNILSLRATGTDAIVSYNGAKLTHAGVWSSVSSRAAKTDFMELDVQEVLDKLAAMPVRQWRYRVEPDGVS